MRLKIKLNPRERILVVTIAIATAILSFVVGNATQNKAMKKIDSSLSTQRAELQKTQQVFQDLSAKAEDLNRVLSGQNNLKKYLEASKYMAELLKELGAREGTKKSDFHLKSLTIKSTEKVNNFNKTTFNLEIDSNFIELGRYLAALEKSDLLVEVKSVKLSRIDNDLKRCVATIEVNGYHSFEAKL